jgi:hypothetical protein
LKEGVGVLHYPSTERAGHDHIDQGWFELVCFVPLVQVWSGADVVGRRGKVATDHLLDGCCWLRGIMIGAASRAKVSGSWLQLAGWLKLVINCLLMHNKEQKQDKDKPGKESVKNLS